MEGRKISEEQFAALESEHGAGNVIVLNVGDDQFAYRRPDNAACMTMLRRRDEGFKSWLEEAARYAVLCPTAPAAGRGPAKDKGLSREERAAIVAERAAFESSLDAAAANGDVIGATIAWFAGYQSEIKEGVADGNVYHVEVTFQADTEIEALAVDMRRLTRAEYSAYRDKIGEVEHALQILGTDKEPGVFGLSCVDVQKAEILERYPLLAYGLGRMAIGLGAESRAVSIKKFAASTPKMPMTSPSEPQTTSP